MINQALRSLGNNSPSTNLLRSSRLSSDAHKLAAATDKEGPTAMETLHTIKSDLVRTADHLDQLSQAMSGHARFMEARGSSQVDIDVAAHIKSIDGVADELRIVAARIDDSEGAR